MGIAPFRARRAVPTDIRYLSNYQFQDAANILLEVPHFLKSESQQNSDSQDNELEIGKYNNVPPPQHSHQTHTVSQHQQNNQGVGSSVHDSDGQERQNENPHDNEAESEEPQDNGQHTAHTVNANNTDDRNDTAKKNNLNKLEQSTAHHTHTPLSSSQPSAHSQNYSRSDEAAAVRLKKQPSPAGSPLLLPVDGAFPNVGPLRNLSKQYVIIPKKSKKVKKNLTVCYYSLTIEKSYLANFSSVDFVNLSFYLKDNEVGYKTIGHQCVTNEEKRLAELNRDDLLFGEILPEGVQKLCDAYHLSVEDSNVRVVYDIGAGLGKIALQVFHEFEHVESVVGCELVESRIKRGMIAMKNYCSLLKIRNKDRRFEYGLQESEKVFRLKEKRYRDRAPPAESVQVHMKKISYDEEKRRDTPSQPPPPSVSVFEERKEKKKDKKKSWKKPWKRFTFPFFSPASFDGAPATGNRNSTRNDGGAIHAAASNGHGSGRGGLSDKSAQSKSERFVRSLEMRNGNLFDLLSDNSKNSIRHADVVFADVNLSPAKYRDFCYFLLQLKNGVRIASYLDLTLLFAACHISCPFFRLSINQSIHDKFLTSWSPVSGHRFHLFIKLENRNNKDANGVATQVAMNINQTPNANVQSAPPVANGNNTPLHGAAPSNNMPPAANISVSCECKNCMLHRGNGGANGSGGPADEPIVIKPMSTSLPATGSAIASAENGAQLLSLSHTPQQQTNSGAAILMNQQGVGAAFETADTDADVAVPPKLVSELTLSGAAATGLIAANSPATDSSGTPIPLSLSPTVSAPFFPAKLQLDANGRAVLSTAAGICYVPLSALTVDGECIRLSAANVNGKLVFPTSQSNANEAARIIVSDPHAHPLQESSAPLHSQQYMCPPASHPHVPSDVSPLRQGTRVDAQKRNVELMAVSPAVFFAANSSGAVTLHDRSIVTVQVQSTANHPSQHHHPQHPANSAGAACSCQYSQTNAALCNSSAANLQTAASGAVLQLHVLTQDVHIPSSQSSPSGAASPLPVTPGPSVMNGGLSGPATQPNANRIFAPSPNACNGCPPAFGHPTGTPSSAYDSNSPLTATTTAGAAANATTPTQLPSASAIQKVPPPTAPLNSASPSTSISSCTASANSSTNGVHMGMAMGMQAINLSKALSVDEQHWHPPQYEDSTDE